MRVPPPEFVRDLTAYDATLRCRWAPRWPTERTDTHDGVGLWVIEKSLKNEPRLLAFLAGRPNPWKSPRGFDLYDGWKDGYDHVMSVHPDLLHWSIVQPRLAEFDKHRMDGWKDLNRRLDEIAEQEEAAADRQIANWSEAAASEAFNRLQWLQGNRVALTTPTHPGLPPEEVEQHDGFVVRVRKRLHLEPA